MKQLLIISCSLLFVCCGDKKMFRQLSSSQTGIHFNNHITESDSVNVLDIANVYNGGGVGIGDFNQDGLPDIYFTGNQVDNKLYLNKGGLAFEDVTATAAVEGKGRWCRGVAVVDINNDGRLDMYVCASILKQAGDRRNLLYVNQGNDKNGIPHFAEMAAAYGLDDTTHTIMAVFFDYDNDNDLDVYLAVNEILESESPNIYKKQITDGSFPSTGRLYRNDWNDSLQHVLFSNVSKQADIAIEGYSHGAVAVDINRDGWKDIYVTNDFLSSNVLFINNCDGTFSDKSKTYFKHTAANAMGVDITDINNDGLADVVELDMNPQDNYRKKMMMNPYTYQAYQNNEYFGYQYQYVRNTLQVNQGPAVLENDTIGNPVFSETGFFSNIAETDWSWTPLVADFDNDGYRDIIVTNGYPKDVTDHDFIAFRQQSSSIAGKEYLLKQIPEVKTRNYAFRNNGDLTFSDVSAAWNITQPSFSNGAAYADFDNDGDMDYVINNINDEAHVFENRLNNEQSHHNYISLRFSATGNNNNGIGVWVELYYDNDKHQVYEHTPYRGYLSSVEMGAHFGVGNTAVIDSIHIKWPDNTMQVMKQVPVNQILTIKKSDAVVKYSWQQPPVAANALFTQITSSTGIHYNQQEIDFVDFNIQRLLPHKFSEYGPALAAGDLDGNGLDDIVTGGSALYSPLIFFQQAGNKFTQKKLLNDSVVKNKKVDDAGILLFDADNDGDLDIYIAAGGYENEANSDWYTDQLYKNDGKANFIVDSSALPYSRISKSCVRAADYDKDGDLDLFVAGRVDPWHYPRPVSCVIYRNDSEKGGIKFTDVTKTIGAGLLNIGMVCDALWTDIDNDGWQDLLLAGEWMPLTFFKNNHGKFTNITPTSGIADQSGWWTSIASGDFDNDGDMDYIAGNTGRNSFYRPTATYPVRIYANDFDNNGSYDAIPTLYLPTSAADTIRKEYPAQLRDDLIKQMIGYRRQFVTYKAFARESFENFLTAGQLKSAIKLSANNFNSSYIRNEGDGRFALYALPVQAQLSCLFGMTTVDADGDGNLDVALSGNDFGTETSVGRYDAFNGLLLKGNGQGDFQSLSITQSGLYIPGSGKALIKLQSPGNNCVFAASQNRGPLQFFSLKKQQQLIPVLPNEVFALLKLSNGKTRKEELHYGEGFYSQSGRFIVIDNTVTAVTITDSKGKTRTVLNNR